MIRIGLIFLALLLLFLGGCETLAKVKSSNRTLPRPADVVNSLIENRVPLTRIGLATVTQALAGLGMAAVVAIITICLAARFPAFGSAIHPYVIMLKATPALAFVPLVMALCGGDFLGKAAIAGIISFMPLVVHGLGGLDEIPAPLRDLRRHCQPGNWTYFTTIAWPYALRDFCFGLKMAGPMAVVGAIVSEFVIGGGSIGIGAFITAANTTASLANVAAAGFTATVLGVSLFGLAHLGFVTVLNRTNLAR